MEKIGYFHSFVLEHMGKWGWPILPRSLCLKIFLDYLNFGKKIVIKLLVWPFLFDIIPHSYIFGIQTKIYQGFCKTHKKSFLHSYTSSFHKKQVWKECYSKNDNMTRKIIGATYRGRYSGQKSLFLPYLARQISLI